MDIRRIGSTKRIVAPALPGRNPYKHPWCILVPPASGRGPLAAPTAPPARRGGLQTQRAARRDAAVRALDRQVKMGYGRASGGYRFEGLGTARTGRLRGAAAEAAWHESDPAQHR